MSPRSWTLRHFLFERGKVWELQPHSLCSRLLTDSYGGVYFAVAYTPIFIWENCRKRDIPCWQKDICWQLRERKTRSTGLGGCWDSFWKPGYSSGCLETSCRSWKTQISKSFKAGEASSRNCSDVVADCLWEIFGPIEEILIILWRLKPWCHWGHGSKNILMLATGGPESEGWRSGNGIDTWYHLTSYWHWLFSFFKKFASKEFCDCEVSGMSSLIKDVSFSKQGWRWTGLTEFHIYTYVRTPNLSIPGDRYLQTFHGILLYFEISPNWKIQEPSYIQKRFPKGYEFQARLWSTKDTCDYRGHFYGFKVVSAEISCWNKRCYRKAHLGCKFYMLNTAGAQLWLKVIWLQVRPTSTISVVYKFEEILPLLSAKHRTNDPSCTCLHLGIDLVHLGISFGHSWLEIDYPRLHIWYSWVDSTKEHLKEKTAKSRSNDLVHMLALWISMGPASFRNHHFDVPAFTNQ